MTRNPDDIKHGSLVLKSKPSARLNYAYIPGDLSSKTLVVFLNGLIMPQASWEETMLQIKLKTQKPGATRPHLLSYDRLGQGLSDRDPTGEHDVADSARDLKEVLEQYSDRLPFRVPSKTPGQLMLVCNSIGCAIARVFAGANPATVSGFVFLDSVMANSDFVSMWPDPDATGFDPSGLPQGTTVDELRRVRQEYRRRFHPLVPNPEGLNRATLRGLLPEADSPRLEGPERGPLLTVVGHDWEAFARENSKSFGVPAALIMKYVNPVWHRYNQGLTKLTTEDRVKDPIIAEGCSHFIQKDNPVFVANWVCEMLRELEKGRREID